jgi:hypothetical protein
LDFHDPIKIPQLFYIFEEENYEGSFQLNSLSMISESYVSVIEEVGNARDIVVLNLIEEENMVLPMNGDIDGTLLIVVNCTAGSLVEENFAKIYNREPISK